MEIEKGNGGGNNGMSPGDVWKIVAGIIAGFGGFGAVIVLVIKFSANIIANRLAEKYSLKMNKELEKYKGTLESKRHISKALFDREFEIYVSFNKVLADLYNDILIFDGIKMILSILVYTFFSRMFDLMLPPVAKHSIVVA